MTRTSLRGLGCWACLSLFVAVASAHDAGAALLRLAAPQSHAGSVEAIAIDASATLVATGGTDTVIHLWHLPSARQWRSLRGHSAGLKSLAFSPDGSLLASADQDGVVQVWRVADGTSLCNWQNTDLHNSTLPSSQSAVHVGWAESGTLWSVGDRGYARQWLVAGCREKTRLSLHEGSVVSLLRDPAGWTLATHDAVLRLDTQGRQQWRVAAPGEPDRLVRHVGGTALLLADGRLLGLTPAGQWSNAPLATFTNGRFERSVIPWGDGWLASDRSLVLERAEVTRSTQLRPLDGLADSTYGPRGGLSQLAVAGQTVVAATGLGLVVLDATTLLPRVIIDAPSVIHHSTMAISPDGARLLVGGISDAVMWDLNAGRPLGTLRLPDPDTAELTAAVFTPDSRHLLMLTRSYRGRFHLVRYTLEGDRFLPPTELPDIAFGLAFDAPRARVLVAAKGGVLAFSAADLSAQGRVGTLTYAEQLDIAPGGTHLVAANPNEAELVVLATGATQARWRSQTEAAARWEGFIRGVRADRDAERVWIATAESVAAYGPSGLQLWRTALPLDHGRRLMRSPDGHTLVAAGSTAVRVDPIQGTTRAMDMPTAANAAVLPDTTSVLVLGADGAVRLWQAGALSVLEWRSFGSPAAFACSSKPGLCWRAPPWMAATPDGRFDLADFAALPGVVWYDNSEPHRPLQLEWFARKAFTPRLIGRALARQLAPAGLLQARAVVPPTVRITSITSASSDPKELRIEIEVEPGSRALGVVQLYRDGSRVARVPASALVRSGQRWKAVVGPVRVRDLGLFAPVTIGALAFDIDGISSSMTQRDHKVVENHALPWAASRTWLVNIGVNRHENSAFDLTYAGNDARRLGAALTHALARGSPQSVISVPLIADTDPRQASKARIREALQVLSGAAPRSSDPELAPLDRARPSDTVVISFSGHGLVGPDGEFYLVPGDIGGGGSKHVTPALLARAISSRELSEWLDGLDADRVTLLLDACHAAAAVDVNGFMPGPMDSAGLGQLAYDKGFAVLVATQADDVALESGSLQHGLLTYALTVDGLAGSAADFAPQDGRITWEEWLRYGVLRVPDLARAIRNGARALPSGSRGAARLGADPSASPPAQSPALFYFSRGRTDIGLADVPVQELAPAKASAR